MVVNLINHEIPQNLSAGAEKSSQKQPTHYRMQTNYRRVSVRWLRPKFKLNWDESFNRRIDICLHGFHKLLLWLRWVGRVMATFFTTCWRSRCFAQSRRAGWRCRGPWDFQTKKDLLELPSGRTWFNGLWGRTINLLLSLNVLNPIRWKTQQQAEAGMPFSAPLNQVTWTKTNSNNSQIGCRSHFWFDRLWWPARCDS